MSALVETSHGKIEGKAHEGGEAYLGIPYARPPVGDLRFRPPEPPEAWSGVRPAVEFGAASLQPGTAMRQLAGQGPQSEDCLSLNVFTPRADGGRRPVMVWIHGGAFTMGSSSQDMYDGAPLAVRGDVVVVTINYRLGALGYLSLGRHGGADWGAAANLGQRDMIAALRFVRDNAAAFGGDPDNVTVFGESAGSLAINVLQAMPEARGLFRRGICQSGAMPRHGNLDSAAEVADAMLAELGVAASDTQELQRLPAERIVAAQRAVAPRLIARRGFFPIVDEDSLPVDVGEALANGTAADVPMIMGTNRDEHNLFILPLLQGIDRPMEDARAAELVAQELPKQVRGEAGRLLETYRSSRKAHGLPHNTRRLVPAIQGDARFRIPSMRVVEARTRAPTYVYLFTQESPAGALGACHALEIPFVMGTLHKPFQDRFVGKGPEVEQLSARLMDAWLAFARGDAPGHAEIGEWVPYERERRATMIFGPDQGLADAPFEEERAAWDGVL